MKSLHFDNTQNLHPFVKSHVANMLVPLSQSDPAPLQSEFDTWRRLVPRTNIPTLSQGAECNFNLSTPHHLQELYCEITLRENNTANATIKLYNSFERVEVEYKGRVITLKYPDEKWFKMIFTRTFEEHRKKRLVEGLNADYTPTSNNLPQNTTKTFYFPFNLFESKPDFRNLKDELLIRFYFNQASYFATGSTDITLANFALLTKSLDVPIFRYKLPVVHRYVNMVRVVENKQMNASSYIDVKLNAFNGQSLGICFVIRNVPSQTSYANWDNYISAGVQSFELHDRSNDLIAIKHTAEMNRMLTLEWDCDYFNQYNNVFVIPFSHRLPSDIMTGYVSGSMYLSSDEILRIDFDSTFVSGNYELTIWSFQLNTFHIHPDGDLTFSH